MMKRNLLVTILLGLIVCNLQAANSAYVTEIIDYRPAPGQHINRLFPPADKSDSHENAVAWASGFPCGVRGSDCSHSA